MTVEGTGTYADNLAWLGPATNPHCRPSLVGSTAVQVSQLQLAFDQHKSLILVSTRRLQRSQALASRRPVTQTHHWNAKLSPDPSQCRCSYHTASLCYSSNSTLRHRHVKRSPIAKAASNASDGHLEEGEEEEATRLAQHVGCAFLAQRAKAPLLL